MDHQYDSKEDGDEENMDDVFEEKSRAVQEERVELTLKDIRDILYRVNTRILSKNMKK